MREGQKRINVYLPDNLYSSVLNSEYKDMTTAVIKGLEKLLEPHREDFEQVHTNTQESSNSLQNELILSLKNHIASLESQIMVKDEQLRTQAVHLQTVLTQKAIGTGSTKEERKTSARKGAPGYSSVVQEYSQVPKQKPDIEPEVFQEEKTKNPLDIVCIECGETFQAQRKTRMFCSKKCEARHRRRKEKEESV